MVASDGRQTASCTKVWELIRRVRGYDSNLSDELSDAFTDFECSWKEHADEYHTS
jgi:hypothetical protein